MRQQEFGNLFIKLKKKTILELLAVSFLNKSWTILKTDLQTEWGIWGKIAKLNFSKKLTKKKKKGREKKRKENMGMEERFCATQIPISFKIRAKLLIKK